MFTLRTESLSDASSAILLPFHSRWEPLICSPSINVVLRRRGPQDWLPTTIYAYFGKPVSAIQLRLRVDAFRWIAVDEAARLASRVGMPERAIREYGENATELCVFEIAGRDTPRCPLPMRALRDRFGYIPTPNYVRLSEDGVRQLNELLGF